MEGVRRGLEYWDRKDETEYQLDDKGEVTTGGNAKETTDEKVIKLNFVVL